MKPINKNVENYEGLNLNQIQNKKLVNILKHKIFRGFEEIKNSKTFFRKKPKCLKIIDFEEHNLEPFDVNYNIQYRRTFLKKLNKPQFQNPFQIQNYCFKQYPQTQINDLKTQEKKSNIFLTNNHNKSKSNLSKINLEKQKLIINELFPNNEGKIYSNIPFLYVERSIKKPENPKEKIILSEGKEYDEYDGLTENQFIFKISHQMNPDKINFNSFRNNSKIKKGYTGREIKSANNRNLYKEIIKSDLQNLNISINKDKDNEAINNKNNSKLKIIESKNTKETNNNDIINKKNRNITSAINLYHNNSFQNNNSGIYLKSNLINYSNNNVNNKSYRDMVNKSNNNYNDLGVQVTISSIKMDKRSESESKKMISIESNKVKKEKKYSRNVYKNKDKKNLFQNSLIKKEFPTNSSGVYSVFPTSDNDRFLFYHNNKKYIDDFKKKTNKRIITDQILIDEKYMKKYHNNYLKRITQGTIE